MNTRIQSFDAVKLIAIFLVIYGHCVQHLLPGFEYDNYVYLYIYSFHMPLFMMVSGYFSHSAMRLSFCNFIRKKSRQLLLPCITWGGVIILVRLLLSEPLSIYSIVRDDLWFLKSLFLCMLLSYVALRVPTRIRFLVFIVFIIITQFSLFRMKDMFVPFLAGFYMKEYWAFIKKHISVFFIVFAAIYFFLSISFINPTFFNVERTSLINYVIKQSIILLTGISGSMIIILLMNMFDKLLSQNICLLGQYTLGIYLIQSVILETVLSHYITMCNVNEVLIYLVLFPLGNVLFIIISVGVIEIIEKNKIMKLLFLGKE